MTRFKELARIRAALKSRTQTELNWALGYCRMRVSTATRKDHVKHWRALERQVKEAMESIANLR